MEPGSNKSRSSGFSREIQPSELLLVFVAFCRRTATSPERKIAGSP